MASIPIYLKTQDDMPRPPDSEYYLMTGSGGYFCRNHPFFTSDVPAIRPPRSLAPHRPHCEIRYPKVPAEMLESVVGFFHRIYRVHGSEAIVMLLWDRQCQEYRVLVPEQEATVFESWSGKRSALDVRYEIPARLPPNCILAASMHSHADGEAYSSWTDRNDENYRDGVHAVCGRLDRDRPQFHLELAVDRYRFDMRFDQLFAGYEQRSDSVPEGWLARVKCKVSKPTWSSWESQSNSWANGKNYVDYRDS